MPPIHSESKTVFPEDGYRTLSGSGCVTMTLPFQELKSGFLAHPLGAQACFMAALTKRMRKEFCVRPRYIVSVEIQVSSVTTVRSLKR